MENGGAHDVSEVYSPPRVTAMVQRMGLDSGWALDLIEMNADDGLPWDFFSQAKRDKALQRVSSTILRWPTPRRRGQEEVE